MAMKSKKLLLNELNLEDTNMFKKSDFFFLLAVMISFFVSGYLWFSGQRMEGIFTAIWVPAILGFGISFKLMVMGARNNE
jgi:hypothetical protein